MAIKRNCVRIVDKTSFGNELIASWNCNMALTSGNQHWRAGVELVDCFDIVGEKMRVDQRTINSFSRIIALSALRATSCCNVSQTEQVGIKKNIQSHLWPMKRCLAVKLSTKLKPTTFGRLCETNHSTTVRTTPATYLSSHCCARCWTLPLAFPSPLAAGSGTAP